MTTTLARTETAIGLYAYNQDDPCASFYARYYELLRRQFSKLGIEPTYFGVSGDDYPDKYMKFGGEVHKRAVATGFQNICGLSIAANPIGSNAPAYDSFFDSSVGVHSSGFPESAGKVVDLWLVIDESFLPFSSSQFEQVLIELIELHDWDCGMGFRDRSERHPELHIGCLGHEQLNSDEENALQTWYSTPPEVRVAKLRSIYPYNIVNELQLSQEIQPGHTLKQWITAESVGTLESLPGGRLHLWKVLDDGLRKAVHDFLKKKQVSVT